MSRYREERDSRDNQSLPNKVYVGDLPREASEKELERAFSYYGPLRNVWVARNPPGFAFVEFEDARDANDAVGALDGTTVCGVKVTVERSTPKRRRSYPETRRGPRGGGPARNRRPFDRDDRCYECGERGHYAYNCTRSRGGGGSSGGGRSRRRSYSRSRSRSPERSRRSYSRSRSRSKSRERRRSPSTSPPRRGSRDLPKGDSKSPPIRATKSGSYDHGSPGPARNGDD